MGDYYLSFDKLLGPDQAYSQLFVSRLSLKHISFKETQAVLFAFWHWLYILAGKHILLYKDNFAVCQRLKHQLIRGPSIILIRSTAIFMALHNIRISSVWILSKDNVLAEMLSRDTWGKIADVYPMLVPTYWYISLFLHGIPKRLCLVKQHITCGGDLKQKLEYHIIPHAKAI